MGGEVLSMTWSTSDRALRLPSDWQDRRRFVAQRAGFQCEALLNDGTRCEAPGAECDHIERGDNHAVNNLRWLCSWHHKRKTQREATEAINALRQSRLFSEIRHPGLLEQT